MEQSWTTRRRVKNVKPHPQRSRSSRSRTRLPLLFRKRRSLGGACTWGRSPGLRSSTSQTEGRLLRWKENAQNSWGSRRPSRRVRFKPWQHFLDIKEKGSPFVGFSTLRYPRAVLSRCSITFLADTCARTWFSRDSSRPPSDPHSKGKNVGPSKKKGLTLVFFLTWSLRWNIFQDWKIWEIHSDEIIGFSRNSLDYSLIRNL